MLANSLTPAKPASIFDLALPTQPGGEQGAGSIDFAALLPSIAPASATGSAVAAEGAGLPGAEPAQAASPEPGLVEAARPTHPGLAETGKILPLVIAALPHVAAETLPATGTTAEPSLDPATADQDGEQLAANAASGADVSPVLLPGATGPVQPAAPAPVTEAETKSSGGFEHAQARMQERHAASGEAAPTQAADRPAKSASTPAIAIQVAVSPERAASSEQAPAVRTGEQASRLAQPQLPGSFSGQDAAPGDERPGAGGAAKSAVRAGDLPRFAQMTDAPGAVMPAALAASGETAIEGAQVIPARFAAEAPAMRELSRIVETLASAREAFGTQTATLALDHAEFGALSLRFDQRPDGLLSVQLSAVDADAQQALATAVAERPVAAPGDAGAATSQNQSQSQAGSQASSSTSQRGAAADREGQAAGHETSREHRGERQRGETRGDDAGPRGQRRSGIYA